MNYELPELLLAMACGGITAIVIMFLTDCFFARLEDLGRERILNSHNPEGPSKGTSVGGESEDLAAAAQQDAIGQQLATEQPEVTLV